MNISKYLSRIGIDSSVTPVQSYEFLKQLQLSHIISVPYENLDIMESKPLSLDSDDIYEKVVERNRGGYCFELNCLFNRLLCEIGFSTENYFARFWRGESGIPIRRHRVIAVSLAEEKYIVDVGIGSFAPRIPLLLKEGIVQEYFGEAYRFERDADFGWMLFEKRGDAWEKYFSFTEEKQLDVDFTAVSFYCEKSPASKFNKSLMVAIKTEDGRKSIDGNVYKKFRGKELEYIEENLTEERLNFLLKNEFGLVR